MVTPLTAHGRAGVLLFAVALPTAGCSGAGRGGGGGPGGGDAGSTGGARIGATGGSAGSTGGGPGSGGGSPVTSGGATVGSGGASAGSGGGAGSGGSGSGTGGRSGNGGAGGAGRGGAGGAILCGTPATLKAAAACTGRLFGAALSSSHLAETAYATAAREHSFVTPENEMKWDAIEPARGGFSYAAADQIVTFAMQNGMKVKGHTLVWHKQLPAWVTALTAAADIRAAMLNHITSIVTHYRGRVAVWDVVNEAWVTTGSTGDGNPVLRDSVFETALGPSFIDEAFTAARQADPTALLVYNEFANEGMSDKSTAVYDMVRDMRSRGIPIDGVGMQMHIGINTNPTAADVAANMQRLADLGLQIFISEMDVNVCAGYSLDQERAQYHDMVAACVAQPACAAITVWGIPDKYSWLNIAVNMNSPAGCATGQLPLPLLFDDSYGKKSAYAGVMDALLGR